MGSSIVWRIEFLLSRLCFIYFCIYVYMWLSASVCLLYVYLCVCIMSYACICTCIIQTIFVHICVHSRYLECWQLLTGSKKWEEVLISQLNLTYDDINLPFTCNRCQCSVNLTYATGINKSYIFSVSFVKISIHLLRINIFDSVIDGTYTLVKNIIGLFVYTLLQLSLYVLDFFEV